MNVFMYFPLLMLLALKANCQQKQINNDIETYTQKVKICSFTVRATFAESGNMKFTISADSVHYSSIRYNHDGTVSVRGIDTGVKPEDWTRLLNSFNLADFEKVKTGKSIGYIDRSDLFTIVETSKGIREIVNPDKRDLEYKRIAKFVDKLWEVVYRLTKDSPETITHR